jgi:hypothetical protein
MATAMESRARRAASGNVPSALSQRGERPLVFSLSLCGHSLGREICVKSEIWIPVISHFTVFSHTGVGNRLLLLINNIQIKKGLEM